VNRGDVVIVPFPYQDKPGQKVRPAVIVQSDAENRRLANTVLAMITGNVSDAGRPTTVLVDPKTPEGAGSGLSGPSLVKCYNLATVRQVVRVLRVIGRLLDAVMRKVNQAMKAAGMDWQLPLVGLGVAAAAYLASGVADVGAQGVPGGGCGAGWLCP